jgi:hypothetical protein
LSVIFDNNHLCAVDTQQGPQTVDVFTGFEGTDLGRIPVLDQRHSTSWTDDSSNELKDFTGTGLCKD